MGVGAGGCFSNEAKRPQLAGTSSGTDADAGVVEDGDTTSSVEADSSGTAAADPDGTTTAPTGPEDSGSTTGTTGPGMAEDTDTGTTDGTTGTSTGVVEAPTRLVLFGGPSVTGDIAAAGGEATGRLSADALCADALDDLPMVSCAHVHAVLSVDPFDEIADMPANYAIPLDLPVEGTQGVVIEDSFEGLLDGDVQVDLSDAHVFDPALNDVSYWTGSTDLGSAQSNLQCEGWTSSVSGPTAIGIVGHASYSDFQWISWGFAGCEESQPLLCICW